MAREGPDRNAVGAFVFVELSRGGFGGVRTWCARNTGPYL